MANAKEIQNRIKSIQDTMKITRAMYMMSSIKLRKAKQNLEDTEPYFYGLQEQITSILYHFPEMEHVYFDNRVTDKQESVKKKGIVVLTGDKGMAGAYNHNLIKTAQKLCDESQIYRLFVVGEHGRQYFTSQGYKVEKDFIFTASNPTVHRARVITELIVQLYKQEELDEVYVIYTRMANSITEEVELQQLLPLKTHEFLRKENRKSVNDTDFYIWPSPDKVLSKVVYNYITGFMYGALVEASASEENARMLAMQSATNNATDMLKALSVQYNRVRQSAITQEITEVIGGAKALKRKKKQMR